MNTEQEKYDYQLLSCALLKLDKYQRACNIERAYGYVEKFNPNLFEAIHVSYRDGQYWVVDGQHRLIMAKKMGYKYILCQIHKGMTYEEEAKMFDELNGTETSKPTTIHARINARLEYSDPATVEIKRIVEESGFIFGMDNSKAVNKIICTSTLIFIYKQIGARGLGRVLYLIKGAWDGIYEAMDKCVLMGVYQFVKNYADEFKDSDFIQKMKKVSPRSILNEGKANKKYSKSAYTPYAIEVLYHYNKGRRYQLQSKF
jgi:hypothetical protein